jgi:hypothetical protein
LLLWVFERFRPPTSDTSNVLEISTPLNWAFLDDSSDCSTPEDQFLRSFVTRGGACSLAGVTLGEGTAMSATQTHVLEYFAAQLEGSSCWGQTGQIMKLLLLLASPSAA